MKNQFFGKKIFRQIFQKKFFAHRIRNFVLIPKWFYFLSFAQNWPICEGLKFLLLKIEDFPFSGVSAPGPPYGVKICPKMVPMIFTGHIMKVYGEIGPKKNLKFKSV